MRKKNILVQLPAEPERRLIRELTTTHGGSFNLQFPNFVLKTLSPESLKQLVKEGWYIEERTNDWHRVD